MWLEAILTRDDLADLVRQFSPLRVRLGDGGELALSAPSELTLVPDQGIELVCAAKVRWPVLGLDVPVTLTSLRVRMRPTVEGAAEGRTEAALVFKLELVHVDVALLPTVLDDKVTARINEELVKHDLAWSFASTMSHVFPLPSALESASALRLAVVAGTVRVTGEALGFAVSFRTAVEHAPPTAEAPPASKHLNGAGSVAAMPAVPPDPDETAPHVPASVRAHLARVRSAADAGTPLATLALRGAVTALAVAATFALGRFSAPRHRWLER